jgi:hypothetical protein
MWRATSDLASRRLPRGWACATSRFLVRLLPPLRRGHVQPMSCAHLYTMSQTQLVWRVELAHMDLCHTCSPWMVPGCACVGCLQPPFSINVLQSVLRRREYGSTWLACDGWTRMSVRHAKC